MRDRTIHILDDNHSSFPPVKNAKSSGLLAVGGELSTTRLLEAYMKGIFPWYSKGCPVMWWSPDPRCVLILSELRVSRSLRREIAKNNFVITQNKAFEEVIHYCSSVDRPHQKGTWLQPEMIEAYSELNRLGYAHSVEAWKDGRLVGGLYGVVLGSVFFGESMFHLEPNASKIAFVALVKHLIKEEFTLIDCQQTTPHMLALGAKEISRKEFTTLLNKGLENFIQVTI